MRRGKEPRPKTTDELLLARQDELLARLVALEDYLQRAVPVLIHFAEDRELQEALLAEHRENAKGTRKVWERMRSRGLLPLPPQKTKGRAPRPLKTQS